MKVHIQSLLFRAILSKRWLPFCLVLSITATKQGVAQYVVPQTGSQNITVCSGTLTDNGGNANYLPNSNGTLTIYPGVAGNYVSLAFISLSLQTTCCASLAIYDGTSTSSTLIWTYYNQNDPGIITASNPSGALTLLFNASGSNPTTAGFEANISCKTIPPIADFTASNAFLNPAWALPGALNSGTFYIRNFSTVSVPATKAAYYLSTDTLLDAQDVQLSTSNVPSMGPYGGASINYVFAVPSNTAVGHYYLLFKADYNNLVTESSETNNLTYGAFYVAPAIADLITAEGFIAPNGTSILSAGGSITATCAVKNPGYISVPSIKASFYLSVDTLVDASDILLGSPAGTGISAYGRNYLTITTTVPANLAAGNYHLLFLADPDNTVNESNESNNVSHVPLTVTNDLLVPGTGSSTFTSCSAVVADNGGVSADYINFSSGTLTLQPSVAGQYATLSFTSFEIESSDYLQIYDGASTSAPLIDLYTGTRPAFSVMASTASGTLTLKFSAGSSGVKSGFRADLSCSNVRSLPDLSLRDQIVTGQPAISGKDASVYCKIYNKGASPVSSFKLGYYISVDTLLDAGDVFAGSSSSSIGGNASLQNTSSITMPANTSAGNYYMIIVADYDEQVAEQFENNNVFVAPVTIVAPYIDLTYTYGTANNYLCIGAQSTVYSQVVNRGNVASPSSVIGHYFSLDDVLDPSDILIGTKTVRSLGVNDYVNSYDTIVIPNGVTSDYHYVLTVLDYNNVVVESNETNNMYSLRLKIGTDINVPPSGTATVNTCSGIVTDPGGSELDYTTGNGTLIINPTTGGGYASITFTQWNLGGVSGYTNVTVYDGPNTSSPVLLYPSSNNPGTVTASNPSGTLTIWFTASYGNTGPGFSGNLSCSALPGKPDLRVQSVTTSPTVVTASNPIAITATLKNDGVTTAPVSNVGFYISSDTLLDGADNFLGFSAVGALAVNSSTTVSKTLTLPSSTVGNYYLLSVADYSNTIGEGNEDNNILYKALTINPENVDLVVANYSAPAYLNWNVATYLANIKVKNIGSTPSVASTFSVYFSTDSLQDNTDQLLGTATTGPLAGNALSAELVVNFTTPNVAKGDYYILLVADATQSVYEINEANNLIVLKRHVYNDIPMPINTTKTLTACYGTITDASGSIYTYGVNNGISFERSIMTIYPGNAGEYVNLVINSYSENDDQEFAVFDGIDVQAPHLNLYSGTKRMTASNPAGALTLEFYCNRYATTYSKRFDFSADLSCSAIPATPDLTVGNTSLLKSSIPAGTSLSLSYDILNIGTYSSAGSETAFFLSTDSLLDGNDFFLKSDLTSGISAERGLSGNNVSLSIPSGINDDTYYYLIIKTDYGNQVTELIENNNTKSLRFYLEKLYIDLNINIGYISTNIMAGDPFTIDAGVRNSGNEFFSDSITTAWYISKDTIIDASDRFIDSIRVSGFQPNYSYRLRSNFSSPYDLLAGNYYVIFNADIHQEIQEKNELNNITCVPFTIITDIEIIHLGLTNSCSATITEPVGGTGNYPPGTRGGYTIYPAHAGEYVSLTFNFASLYLFDYFTIYDGENVAAPDWVRYYGNSNPGTTVRASGSTGALTIYFYSYNTSFSAAGFEAIAHCESTPAQRNIVLHNIETEKQQAVPGESIPLRVSVLNNGNVDTYTGQITYYLSKTNVVDNDAVLLTQSYINYVTPSDSFSINTNISIPSTISNGDYFIIGVINYDDSRQETNENDNVFVTSLKISNTTAINNTSSTHQLILYPNPSNGVVTIELETETNEPFELSISNSFGETILTKTILNTSSLRNLSFNTLSSGFYTLQLKQGEKQYQGKLIITK